MLPFILYFVAGGLTAAHVYVMLSVGTIQIPQVVLECASLAGSLVLIVSSYISLFRPLLAARFALLASLGIWCFYGPAIVGSLEVGKRASHSDFRVAVLTYGAVAILVFTTCYSTIVNFRNTEGGRELSWFLPGKISSRSRLAVGICSVILFAATAGWLATGVHQARRPSSKFLIPLGYTGWVRIEFNVVGTLATPEDHGHYILKIPSDGMLKTSSPERFGWGADQYFYVSNDVLQKLPSDSLKGRLVWGQINGEDVGPTGRKQYEEFFVGTEEQFKQLAGNKEIGRRE